MSTTERAQSDLKKLKTKYSSQLSTLKELFTEWTDDDLLFTLQDADGDLELAIDRISEGHANQWGEVKTKKSKKEAAAANKATLETTAPSAAPSAPTYPSYSTNRPSKPLKQRSAAPPPAAAASSSRSKPHAVAWEPSKKSDFDGWSSSRYKLNDGNGWNSVDNSTPKKISSTPSTSTKTSNSNPGGSGAKTWASLLQSKTVPEQEPVQTGSNDTPAPEKELPPLQKVDNAWLAEPSSTSDSLSQWDQPIQDTIKSSSPPSPPPSAPVAAAVSTQHSQVKKSLDDDIPINFNSLSLQEKENVPEVSSTHPSVADLLNSVKQQDEAHVSQKPQPTPQHYQAPQLQQQQNHLHQPVEQQMYQQMYQQQHHQQQQQQQHQYQQFGMHGYSSFNTGYGMYGSGAVSGNSNATDSFFQSSSALFSNQHPQDNDANVNNSKTTTSSSSSAAANGGIPAANDIYHQQPQQYNSMQSFYPYYYMQNQFNAYPSSSYGQPSLNHRYDQSGTASLVNPISSPYGNASSTQQQHPQHDNLARSKQKICLIRHYCCHGHI
ncbi:hypothetical protein [Parasitella parasitica]|uniref:RNA polymerase II degradation factor 1 n=1 Tax=Parasitella parasitica TaxID=35722 RepID=A0A0B7NAN0_9FUNG|nr:hypothetical protein [Parasitella parasitica]